MLTRVLCKFVRELDASKKLLRVQPCKAPFIARAFPRYVFNADTGFIPFIRDKFPGLFQVSESFFFPQPINAH